MLLNRFYMGGLEMFGLFRRVFASWVVGATIEVAVLSCAIDQVSTASWTFLVKHGLLTFVFTETHILNVFLFILATKLGQFIQHLDDKLCLFFRKQYEFLLLNKIGNI